MGARDQLEAGRFSFSKGAEVKARVVNEGAEKGEKTEEGC